MLARTARALALTSRKSAQSTTNDDSNDVIIHLEILMHPLQGLFAPWYHLARTLAPVYQNLQHIFIDDVDRVAQLLLDLEPMSEYDCMYLDYDEEDDDHRDIEIPDDLLNPLNLQKTADPASCSLSSKQKPDGSFSSLKSRSNPKSCSRRFANSERELPPRKQRKSTYLTQPIVIPSTHPSTPTIIITPSSPENCSPSSSTSTYEATFSSRVPIQDSAFRSRLTVPRHPTFNYIFPPMSRRISLPSSPSSEASLSSPKISSSISSSSIPILTPLPSPVSLHPLVEAWRWKDGHWQAVIPGLEEQIKKGWFSRVVPLHGHGRRNRMNISIVQKGKGMMKGGSRRRTMSVSGSGLGPAVGVQVVSKVKAS